MAKNDKIPPSMKHEVGVTVRLDWTSLRQLNDISLYEREKRAVVLRRIVVDKIKVYECNPAFKRFQKSLGDRGLARIDTTIEKKLEGH